MSQRRRFTVSVVVTAAAGAALCLPGSAFAAASKAGVSAAVHRVSAAQGNAVAKGTSPALKTFTSSSSKSAAAAAGTTIYVNGGQFKDCSASPGTGTAADPYCSLQTAVDAASSGDTISVAFQQYPYVYPAVTVSTSGITIQGNGSTIANSAGAGLVLSGVTGVTVSNFTVTSPGSSVVQVVGSHDVVLDTMDVATEGSSTTGAIAIDGASSGITVSRSIVSQRGWSAGAEGIVIASGASNVDLASDVIATFGAGGVVANGVAGLDVVGDTIQRSCAGAISVGGASTGVSIENNLLEDDNSAVAYNVNGDEATCTQDGLAWAPSVTVTADTAAATTSDYNDFLFSGSTAPYAWGGTVFGTIAAMQKTGVDPHDMLETKEPRTISTSTLHYSVVPAILLSGSTGIGAANPNAPGALSTDLYGVSPYTDCGAVAFTDDHLKPKLILADVSATGIEASVSESTGDFPIDLSGYSINWGDGTVTGVGGDGYVETHDYAARGTYQITLTVTDDMGDSASVTESFSTAPDDHMVANLSVSDTSAYGVTASGTASTGDDGVANYDYAWGDGAVTTNGASTATHTYASPGTYTVTLTAIDAHADSATTSVTITTAGSDYTAYGPVRLLDTRSGTGGVSSPLTSAAPIRLKVAGNGSIPANVTAVAMNVTVTNASGYGNVAVNPDGATPSGTSNLNYGSGQTVANMVIVPVGKDGYVSFSKQGPGAVAVIADAAGYYTPTAASGYTAGSPTRILDTRDGTGGVSQPLTSTAPIKLKIAGNGSIPANVTAVAVNLTLTSASGYGNVVAYPDGSTQPTASNLNYSAGQTIANAAIVPVTDGYIDLAKQGPGGVAMIVDVDGYFSPDGAGAYVPVTPSRLFDSRKVANGKLPAGYADGLGIDQDSSGDVLPGVTSLVLNSTVTNVTGTGFLTVFPDNTDGLNGEPLVPNASNLNFGAGATVANLTFATPGTNGVVDFYNGARSSSLDLIVDIFGFYQKD
ncbi:MAG TPA: PKD domain-containing protein [Actinospica sp.]|nr:PKD domain-containing protein [Actinospica sp.]